MGDAAGQPARPPPSSATCRSCASSRFFSLTSVARTRRARRPWNSIGLEEPATSSSEPSFLRCFTWVAGRLGDPESSPRYSRRAGTSSRRTDVLDRHGQELVPRIAVEPDGGVVDGQEGERLRVEHPHGMRVAVEEEAVLFPTVHHPPLRGPPLGDVRPGADGFAHRAGSPRAARTRSSSARAVKGFSIRRVPASRTPLWAMTSSV